MRNEVDVRKTDSEIMLDDLQNTQKMCQMLMQTPHYKKIGAEGIYAIVEKAKGAGVSPTEALNGGMFFVQGKVEMTAGMMNDLIRRAGHSITKDKKSDDSICILHGKRKDTNDTWSESFSIEDAKKAGIYRNQWLKYPRDMLFARALSRLARQLFPDVIRGCYVENEIPQTKEAEVDPVPQEQPKIIEGATSDFPDINHETITEEQAKIVEDLLEGDDELYENIVQFLDKKFGYRDLRVSPAVMFDKLYERAKRSWEERKGNPSDYLESLVEEVVS